LLEHPQGLGERLGRCGEVGSGDAPAAVASSTTLIARAPVRRGEVSGRVASERFGVLTSPKIGRPASAAKSW
jgi:hypothetical protein